MRRLLLLASAMASPQPGGASVSSLTASVSGLALCSDAKAPAAAAAAAAAAVAPRAYHNPRKLSVLSNAVPPCLKGVCYTMRLSGGSASVGRLSNVKVDPLAALAAISAAARARGLPEGADADLETCLAGWHDYMWARFCCLIPIEVDEAAYRALYHESRMCAVTRRCHLPDCVEVL